MLVENLIKELQRLPKGSTIGLIDGHEYRVENEIFIRKNNDTTYDGNGYNTPIKEIEDSRKSNKERLCDYYIV